MDVSDWTLAERMALPDLCFPNRMVVNAYRFNDAIGTSNWSASDLVLPDPMCIWQVNLYSMPSNNGTGRLRVALRDEAPVNQAQMDAAQEIFPDFGDPAAGPQNIPFFSTVFASILFDVRKGMVTGGKKLVIENQCVAGTMRLGCTLIVSGLPTQVSNMFNPKIA